MQATNRIVIIAVSMAALSVFAFFGCRTFFPLKGTSKFLYPSPFERRIVSAMYDCMPPPQIASGPVASGPNCPCPLPPPFCNFLYVLNDDPIRPFFVDFGFSYDSTDQSITAKWNIISKITKEDSARLSQPPSKPFFGRDYSKELAEFYWNDLGQIKSSSLPLELKASYGASYERPGDLKVEIHVVVDAIKNSLFYGIKLTPRRNSGRIKLSSLNNNYEFGAQSPACRGSAGLPNRVFDIGCESFSSIFTECLL